MADEAGPSETPEFVAEDPVVAQPSSEVFGSFNAADGWTTGRDLRFGVFRLTRQNVTLDTAEGRTLTPVDVGAVNKFLSKPRMLGWASQWTGWVAFDNSGTEIRPVSMSYQDGNETLIQVFQGTRA